MKSLIEFSKVVAESKTCWDFAQNINFCATHISIYSLFSRFLSYRPFNEATFSAPFCLAICWFNPLDPFLHLSLLSKIHSYLVFSRYEKSRESNIHIYISSWKPWLYSSLALYTLLQIADWNFRYNRWIQILLVLLSHFIFLLYYFIFDFFKIG